MNRLLKIIKTFKNKDIQSIEKYISLSTKSGKKLFLFKLIREEKKTNVEELSSIIFGKISITNLKKLEDRLLQDIEDYIFLKYNKLNSANPYESDRSNVITLLLLSQYYLQHGLYPEANKKLRKAKRLITEHNFVVFENIYYQLYCDYLHRIGDNNVESEIKESIRVLSELQFIQTLKLKGVKSEPSGSTVENELLPVINCETRQGAYTKLLMKLTQIKHLIATERIDKAEAIYNSILPDVNCWIQKIPFEMYVEILLQKVKINIIMELYKENILLLENIKRLGISSENIFYEYLKLRFINFFALGNSDVCKSILFFFFSDKRAKGNISENITCQWHYFNICLLFINGQYETVMKMLLQFSNHTTCDEAIFINIRILEIYLLKLIGKDELALAKVKNFKQLIFEKNYPRQHWYECVVDKISICLKENQSLYMKPIKTKAQRTKTIQPEKQNYLSMELISFEMFEEAMKKESKKYQIVM